MSLQNFFEYDEIEEMVIALEQRQKTYKATIKRVSPNFGTQKEYTIERCNEKIRMIEDMLRKISVESS